MKKLFWSLLGVFAFSFGLAQTPGLGFYSGYPTYLGVQYQSNNLRLGAGFGFAGDAALILTKVPVPGSSGMGMSWYYGLGLGASASLGGAVFGIYPHGLVGVEIQLPELSVNPYLEGQIGAHVLFPTPIFGPYFAGRVGVILR